MKDPKKMRDNIDALNLTPEDELEMAKDPYYFYDKYWYEMALKPEGRCKLTREEFMEALEFAKKGYNPIKAKNPFSLYKDDIIRMTNQFPDFLKNNE